MSAREPSWWYVPDRRLPRALLAPVAAIYGVLAARRMRQPPRYRSPLPVICVGNFTAGGTGKTPLTAAIAAHLVAIGAAPAILSRGYGGTIEGPHWVDPARDRANEVGDEPLQHASNTPTLIARDRVEGARAIETDLRAFTHILMDDGLQNPTLAKSLRIALVDGVRGLGNRAVIPAGPLRAPLDVQFAAVDAVVVNRGFSFAPGGVERPAGLEKYAGPVFEATIAPAGKTSWLAATPVLAFAGIGAPAQFFRMLRDLGATLVGETAFADHHAFTDTEASELLSRATALGATLVTTQKDLARLSGLDGARGELRTATQAVPIRMSASDPAFLRLIERA